MFRRPHQIGFAVAFVALVALLILPPRLGSRLKMWAGGVFLPVISAAETGKEVAEGAASRLTPRSVLEHDLQKLARENEELRFEALQLQEARRENASLREALKWGQRSPWRKKLARVVAREPANWWRTLTIDLGSADGISNNLPCLTAEGLVGRVEETGRNHARIVLLGDPNCRVSAHVELEGVGKDYGVIAPVSGLGDDLVVELTYLPRHSRVRQGQRVFTSGLGGTFPRGIPIGEVIEVAPVGYGIYLEAKVKLSAQLNELEHLWVVFPDPAEAGKP